MGVPGPRRGYHRPLGALALAALLAALLGCLSGDVDYSGKACDGKHPCPDGYECLDNTCRALDGGAR